MNTDNQVRPRTGFDGAIVVLVLTALAYTAAYQYQWGYLSGFGVPVIYIDVSIRDILLCGTTVLMFPIVLYLDVFIWRSIPKSFPLMLSQILLTVFLLAFLATAFAVLTNEFRPLPALLGMLAFAVMAFLLVPLATARHIPGYLRKLRAAYTGRSFADIKPKFLWFLVPKFVMAVGLGAFVVGGFAHAIGQYRARTQNEFPILANRDCPNICIVLRVSDKGYLCVEVDPKTLVSTGSMKLVDPVGVEVNTRKLGRIKSRSN
jgi:hypothetical protein